jgi:hypothetical protein
MKTIITKVENNRVAKYLEIDDELSDEKLEELLDDYPDAFIYDGDYSPELWVEDDEVTIQEVIEPVDVKRARLEGNLDAIERNALMPRGAREAFILLCQQQAQAAGLTEAQAYKANPFYKGLKDTDVICSDLRAQIKALK